MKTETYKAARERLLKELEGKGFHVKPTLKIPQAVGKFQSGSYTLFFRTQAVYLDAHSLWIDIRGMGVDMLMAHVEKAREIRSRRGDGTAYQGERE